MVDENTSPYSAELLSGFCHWTYNRLDKQYMVLDIQGIGKKIFDPTLSSRDKTFRSGTANFGERAFDNFKEHECNVYW